MGRVFRKAFRILGLLGEKEKKTAEPRITSGGVSFAGKVT